MKKFLIVLAAAISLSAAQAYADPAAKIRFNISGTARDNTYFLCIPNVGCLSILAGDEGKTYPVFHPIEMDGIYVTNIDHNFQLSDEGLPSSCKVTVQTKQTITISGSIHTVGKGNVILSGLHCNLS